MTLITLPYLPFSKGSSHILFSKIKQIFCGHMVLDEKGPVLQGAEEIQERRRTQGAKKLAVLIPFPFHQIHPQGLALSCVMSSFHILTDSRGTKLKVGDILGKGILGLPTWTF